MVRSAVSLNVLSHAEEELSHGQEEMSHGEKGA